MRIRGDSKVQQHGVERTVSAPRTDDRFLLFLLVLASACFVADAGSHRRHGHGLGCTRCNPGFAVLRPCGHGADTECAPCRPGQYLPHHSLRRHCFPCSLCGAGLFLAHPCRPTRDAVCDSCHTQVTGPHGHDFYLKCRNGSNSEVVYGHGDLPLQDEEEELWKRRETPAEVMLVKEELTHMRHEDRPVPLEHVRSHNTHQKHTKHHAASSLPQWGGGSSTTVVTTVVSICAMAGLLLAVVLSRWRTDPKTSSFARSKTGYVVVSQVSSENSSPV